MKEIFFKKSVMSLVIIAASIGVAHGTTDINRGISPKIITVGSVDMVENQIHDVGLSGAKLTGIYTIASGIETASTRKWYMIPREVEIAGTTCVTEEGTPLSPCTFLAADAGDHNRNSHLPLDSGDILDHDYQGQKVVFCVIPTGSETSDGPVVSGEPECTISQDTLQPLNDRPTAPAISIEDITMSDDPVNTNSTLTVTYTYEAPTSGSNIGEEEGATLLYWQNEEGTTGTIEIDEYTNGASGSAIEIDTATGVHTATVDLAEFSGTELLKIETHKLKACVQPITEGGVHGELTCSSSTPAVGVPDTDEAPVVTNLHIRNNTAAVSELKVGKQYHPGYKYTDADGDLQNIPKTAINWHVFDEGGTENVLAGSYYFTPTAPGQAKVCITPQALTGNNTSTEECSEILMIID